MTSVQIGLDVVSSRLGDEDGAVLAALAADHKLAALKVDGVAIEAGEFGDAETTGKKQLDDGAVAEAGFGVGRDFGEQPLNFVVVEEGNLFADDAGEFDETGVKGGDVALGEIFEEAAEGDEVVGLSDRGEGVALGVGDAVETEAVFADEFTGKAAGFEVIILAGNFPGQLNEAREVVLVIFNGALGTTALDFQVFEEIGEEIGEGEDGHRLWLGGVINIYLDILVFNSFGAFNLVSS